MRTSLARLVAGVLAASLALGACTGDAPTPDPSRAASEAQIGPQPVDDGFRIAIVVGPRSLVASGEAAALATAAPTLGDLDGVTEVRVLTADTPAFASDLLRYAADDGYDLVCLVGTGTARLLATAAQDRRATSFCGTDASIEAPTANVKVVGMDAEALLHVAAVAVGRPPSPVGLISALALGPAETTSEQFSALLKAAPATLVASPAPAASPDSSVSPGPATAGGQAAGAGPSTNQAQRLVTIVTGAGALPTASAVEQLVAADPSVVALLSTTDGAEAARTLAASGVLVVTIGAWAVDDEGALPGNVLVALTVDWAAMLRAAVVAARDATTPQVATLGAQDKLFGVLEGQAPGGAAAAERVRQHLADAAA